MDDRRLHCTCKCNFIMALALLMDISSIILVDAMETSCQFPIVWAGTWFQSGIARQVHIDRHTFSTKGRCIKSSGDKFLIEDRKENLTRCVVIIEKHHNVLQYKEAFTDRKESLESLCSHITGDDPLFSMVRVGATPVPCPFKGPFQFTYYRGYSPECENPPSNIDACTDDWRLLLRFQACPDIIGSESTVEELMCLANWKEGSMHYLVGQLERKIPKLTTTAEDKYRCFVYEKRKGFFDGPSSSSSLSSTGIGGGGGVFHLAQSGDATCNGLQTVEGWRTLKLTKPSSNHVDIKAGDSTTSSLENCNYPAWMIDVTSQWHTLDWRRTYTFGQHNETLKVTNASDVLEMKAVCAFYVSGDNTAATLPTASKTSNDDDFKKDVTVTLVAHATEGCKVGYVCMVFYQRTNHVVEFQMSNFARNREEVCSAPFFDPSSTPFVTLITSNPQAHQCPDLGGRLYSRFVEQPLNTNIDDPVTIATNNKLTSRRRRHVIQVRETCPEFTAIRMGCDQVGHLEFQTDCQSEHRTESHECHADWQENGTNYLITSVKGTHKRYCFVYTTGDKLLRFSSVQDSCRRNSQRGGSIVGRAIFNITNTGRCSESADSGSSSQQIAITVIVLGFLTLTHHIIFFQFDSR